jgi:A/G-specific adenine glycosylase
METAYGTELAGRLCAWFIKEGRPLPWRENREPYRVWVSEIMLQQTRIAAVIPYFLRFTRELPDVFALAAADENTLLRLWEGLGYYSRVRNLGAAAKIIRRDFGGVFPGDYGQIRRLPGIGDYTAGTIASVCFNAPAPAVDGNVLRVLSRCLADDSDNADPQTRKKYRDTLLPLYTAADNRGVLTESLMELGETICLPKSPRCGGCPVQELCKAYANGLTGVLPRRSAKKAKALEQLTVFILRAGGRTVFRKRGKTGLLAGLWELPNLPGRLPPADALKKAEEVFLVTSPAVSSVKTFRHEFTHKVWDILCYDITCAFAESGESGKSRDGVGGVQDEGGVGSVNNDANGNGLFLCTVPPPLPSAFKKLL